jgi:hypothetical protein
MVPQIGDGLIVGATTSEIHGGTPPESVVARQTDPWDPVHGYDASDGGQIWGSRSNPTETATTADNLMTTRSVDHTQVEVESRTSIGRLWAR